MTMMIVVVVVAAAAGEFCDFLICLVVIMCCRCFRDEKTDLLIFTETGSRTRKALVRHMENSGWVGYVLFTLFLIHCAYGSPWIGRKLNVRRRSLLMFCSRRLDWYDKTQNIPRMAARVELIMGHIL